jgi:diguanylate cyclase (GGDEF)-like protein
VGKHLVALRLGQAGPAAGRVSEASVLRQTLDEALGTLVDVLATGDAETLAETIAAVDRCRAELAAGAGADALDPIARACFESARHVTARARIQAAEQRAQVAALVDTVRETVAAIAGDHETLAGSAERFERLARVDDLRQIQAQLLTEVATLKRITIERRAAWQQTFHDFGTRLTSLETQLDRSRREAAVDPLTNVANRRTFERTCREWLEPSRPGFAIAMVDVDDFKAINDRYGHATGDRVLVAVAETLVGSLRSGDLVARLGGDEFAILAAGLTLRQAEGRLAVIGAAVRAACRPLVEEGLSASISIGVAECSAGDTLQSVQHRADTALYQAKRDGKGRVAAKASPLIRDLLAHRGARARS